MRFPGADARRAALAGHPQDPPPGLSMSNDKYDAITGSGIEVGERVKIPDALVPADAKGGDRGEDRGGLLHRWQRAGCRAVWRRSRGAGLTWELMPPSARCAIRRRYARAPRGDHGLRGWGARSTSASTARSSTPWPSASLTLTRALPRPEDSVPQPLAPFRGRRRDMRPSSMRKLAGRTQVAIARSHRSHAGQRAAPTPAPGPTGASTRPRGPGPARSEGLGVASFTGLLAGRFSSDAGDPCRVDAAALLKLDAAALAASSRCARATRLVGLEGRAALMRRLGACARSRRPSRPSASPATRSMRSPTIRTRRACTTTIRSRRRCTTTCRRRASSRCCSMPSAPSGRAGSCSTACRWRCLVMHPAAGGEARAPAGALPQAQPVAQFIRCSGTLRVGRREGRGLDALTGLPEYRNGGLPLDAGVIVPRDAA